jgi:hypothetical protein
MIDVVFSFDTTGSMYPCLAEVRRNVQATVTRLFQDIPDIRIGIIAHGDYCDAGKTYVTKVFTPSDDPVAINRFVSAVERTFGGDAAECYEYVLYQAREFIPWRDGKRVLVMIADDVPHKPQEMQNTLHLNWRTEAQRLHDLDIDIYSVQCLGNCYATAFYTELAQIGGGKKLDLHQFKDIPQLVQAVCYKQVGDDVLDNFAQVLQSSGLMNRGIATFLAQLSGTAPVSISAEYTKASDLEPVPPFRFQLLHVDGRVSIRDFVESTGAEFRKGHGFYELTKSELVQERKEVVLVDRKTGDMFSGGKAREMLGLPYGVRGKVYPRHSGELAGYDVFIQSTSYNRVLVPHTRFLYEAA